MNFSNFKDLIIKKSGGRKLLRIISRKLNKYRLGELLLSKGLINDLQLEYALLEQKRTGEKLGKVLIRQGSISAGELYYKLTEQWCARMAVFGLAVLMQVLAPSITSGNIFAAPLTHNISIKGAANNTLQNRPSGLFGFQEIKSADVSSFKKWTSMISRFDEQLNSLTAKAPKVRLWQETLYKLKEKTQFEQLNAVNNFFNSVKYIEDMDNYHQGDYWATPIEFVSRGGDCEDFAIAKYASLIKLGFNTEQLRISVVYDEVKKLHHAVLVVSLEEGTFVLDNQNKKVSNIDTVTNYKPLFSINNNNWWLHKSAGEV